MFAKLARNARQKQSTQLVVEMANVVALTDTSQTEISHYAFKFHLQTGHLRPLGRPTVSRTFSARRHWDILPDAIC